MELRSGYVVGTGVLRPEHRPFFEEGVRLLLQRWTALGLAIQNEWGGANSKEKAEFLYNDVLTWFYRNKEHYTDELEDALEDAMQQDFNVEAQDGSITDVAKSMVKLYQECLQGGSPYLEHLRATALSGAAQSQRAAGDDDDESSSDEDDDMEEEDGEGAPQGQVMQQEPQQPAGPVVDEDGFELVQSKRKGGRR